MSKLKNFLPSLFGGKIKETPEDDHPIGGRLESDALPVDQTDENDNDSIEENAPNYSSDHNTPSVSADLTASAVRELSDPNYNSRELVTSDYQHTELANGGPPPPGSTLNTMHVNNAQQQVVMQFSNVNKLHFGSVYNFNSNLSANSSCKSNVAEDATNLKNNSCQEGTPKRQKPRKTTSIEAMMQCQEEPNHRMLDTVATHLGEGWKEVMRKLGRSEGQIDQAVIDHQMHGGIKEVIYQLLLQWTYSADDNVATLGALTCLLWELNHQDCVQRMKLVWKAEAKKKSRS